ncbi:lipoate--protein ligase [Paenibacillus sp. FSL W8-1187]|uniref:lipoate--protein ligase n=1 Tax=Paenibacillus pasadenensis TaxID=217090 RepID=A0A2N5NAJ5_9BACL|nr:MULTISPECIES: lipoate--protein ligase [Paenibacillus]PLT47338.1 Lipoate-protein ligase A [Paenibacillus pasadenensis]QGG57627.1 lipoate--protein ligase [Paenibacillus sp. B01]
MLFVSNRDMHDPSLNLALEEYILRHLPADNDYLLFYINEPSIIIGKNQNTLEEINEEYVKEQGIHVVRRLSGGGAVYHDHGNLNYSFITKDDGESFRNYRKFTAPVIEALRSMGVEAELSGRNDIQVGERKISGNAQFATRGRMYTHGTLLFQSDISHVASALKVNPEKFKSKSTKSVRSRVANISEFLQEPMSVEQFRSRLLSALYEGRTPETYELSAADWEGVRKLADERYRSWDWNYGRSPAFNMRQVKRLSAGTYDVRLNVASGRIEQASIYGDFFGIAEVAELEELLSGIRYEPEAVREALAGVDLVPYLGPVELDEFLQLLF